MGYPAQMMNIAYKKAPSTLLNNLVSYWKLDESSGNAADSVGSNTLTASGAGFAAGKINNGDSQTAGQYFGRGDSCGITNGSFSVSTWIKPTALPTADQSSYANTQVFYAHGNTSVNVSFFMTLNRTAGVQQITINRQRQLAENGQINYNFTTPTSSFTHVVGTFDGTTLTLYVNGTSVATYTVTGLNGSGGPVTDETRIGGEAGTYGSAYAGLIDETGLWSRALTSAEVSSLYASGAGNQYPF